MEWVTAQAAFRLTILGYQFPDAEGETYDANWLRIRVEAAGKSGAWCAVDPCLLADEVAALADWLAQIERGDSTPPAISFLQPGLLLRRVSAPEDGERLRVHFGALFPVEMLAEAAQAASPDRWLDFPLSQLDLRAAVQSLRAALRRFPERREG